MDVGARDQGLTAREQMGCKRVPYMLPAVSTRLSELPVVRLFGGGDQRALADALWALIEIPDSVLGVHARVSILSFCYDSFGRTANRSWPCAVAPARGVLRQISPKPLKSIPSERLEHFRNNPVNREFQFPVHSLIIPCSDWPENGIHWPQKGSVLWGYLPNGWNQRCNFPVFFREF